MKSQESRLRLERAFPPTKLKTKKAEFIYCFTWRSRKRMKTAAACGGPIRQALIPGRFLMARWSRNREGLPYHLARLLCKDLQEPAVFVQHRGASTQETALVEASPSKYFLLTFSSAGSITRLTFGKTKPDLRREEDPRFADFFRL